MRQVAPVTLVFAMAVPLLNWMPSRTILDLFQIRGPWFILVKSVNGIAVLGSWLLSMGVAAMWIWHREEVG